MKKIFTALALAVATFAASAVPVSITSGAGLTNITVDPATGTSGTFTILGMEHAGAPSMSLSVANPGGGTTGAMVGGVSATFVDTFGGDGFIAYCIEIFTRASPNGMGVGMQSFNANSAAVSRLFAYSDSLNEAVPGIGYGGSAVTDNAISSAGLQLALWELLYDNTPGSLTTGKFTVAGGGATGTLATAWGNSLLTNYTGFNAYSTSLTAFTDTFSQNKGYQDFVTATRSAGSGNDVPEPGSLALAGLGLFGLAALSRRRKA